MNQDEYKRGYDRGFGHGAFVGAIMAPLTGFIVAGLGFGIYWLCHHLATQ